jgi:hypothetical protein
VKVREVEGQEEEGEDKRIGPKGEYTSALCEDDKPCIPASVVKGLETKFTVKPFDL